LQNRYAEAAPHALNVALICSAWSLSRNLGRDDRYRIEVAALLHDVGMIGIPDGILQKPGYLTADESETVSQGRRLSQEVLRASCMDQQIVEIVAAVSMAGTKRQMRREDCHIQTLGGRMIAIAEAFDAMTSDRPHRRAVSRAAAIAELQQGVRTQFDPRLLDDFIELIDIDQVTLRWKLARMWLSESCVDRGMLDPSNTGLRATSLSDSLGPWFGDALLANTHDTVVCVDRELNILAWNASAAHLTGIDAGTSQLQRWNPRLLHMWDEDDLPLRETYCPIRRALESGKTCSGRYSIQVGDRNRVPVTIQCIPVADDLGIKRGAAILLRDVSEEASLQERCRALSDGIARDSLTGCANRAAFDSQCDAFVEAFRLSGTLVTMIICDLDHFKSINDTYGHQAGDDVIASLGMLLRASAGPRDLAARYGGEEFVLLCRDCDGHAGTRRAEQLRKELSQLAHQRLRGRRVTGSFGVTEIQPGDTAETFLHRADRALLMAKEGGRNRVVRLTQDSDVDRRRTGFGFLRNWLSSAREIVLEQDLAAPGPLSVCLTKLRGFIDDHNAKMHKIGKDTIEFEIDGSPAACRRQNDRPSTFAVVLALTEVRRPSGKSAAGSVQHPAEVRVTVQVLSRDTTDRRRTSRTECAMSILSQLQAYLMVSVD
jgi:diguanylate cyclase (GGDEF)-like protein